MIKFKIEEIECKPLYNSITQYFQVEKFSDKETFDNEIHKLAVEYDLEFFSYYHNEKHYYSAANVSKHLDEHSVVFFDGEIKGHIYKVFSHFSYEDIMEKVNAISVEV